MKRIEKEYGGTGYWSLCDDRFELWDRGDTIAEISFGHMIVAWVRADPLENDPDWEKLYERGTAFPGKISASSALKFPDDTGPAVESIEHLERILAACEVIPR